MNNGQIYWSPGVTLEEIEEQVIKRAFDHFGRHKPTTAQALGIALRTLDNKLAKYAEDQTKRDAQADIDFEKRKELLARSRGIQPEVKKVEPVEDVKAEIEDRGEEKFQTTKLKTKTNGR